MGEAATMDQCVRSPRRHSAREAFEVELAMSWELAFGDSAVPACALGESKLPGLDPKSVLVPLLCLFEVMEPQDRSLMPELVDGSVDATSRLRRRALSTPMR